ncbi:MAG: ketoacyl-ACP synthase III [Lachnospiraceae bacterium]|nr:ketoacyl-ACP synthase III [Lachnospiraceae bacterium]
MIGVIAGTGSYAPVFVLENQDITKFMDTSDAWIRERTGIERRHIAKGEKTTSMAAKAAKTALEDASMRPEELDMIMVSSVSSDVLVPCTACEVQREIGAQNAFCFDLNAACSGFLLAYCTACAYIESGICKTILVIGCESLSNVVDWRDRGTAILFGDGAGAAVVRAGQGERYLPVLHSDGALGTALTLCGQNHHHFFKDCEANDEEDNFYIQMNGKEIFKFAVRKIPQVVEEVLLKNNMTRSDIKYYILHQANKRIIESIAKKMKEPIGKFPMNLQEYGNTSSASIPLLLHELNEKGMLQSGDHIVMAGFGGGLTWGAVILTWQC